MQKGKPGEVYNIGGNGERDNLSLVKRICQELGKPESLITFVTDRKGHDLRYAIDAGKLRRELSWQPRTSFDTGLRKTVSWYLENRSWWEEIVSGEYQENVL